MDFGMQRYLKVLTESENLNPEDLEDEEVEPEEVFEGADLDNDDLSTMLVVNEEDIDTMFEIMSQGLNPEATLKKIDSELAFQGIEHVSPDDSEEYFYFLRNGDLYKDTIIYFDGKYYVGAVGALLESDFDLGRLIRVK